MDLNVLEHWSDRILNVFKNHAPGEFRLEMKPQCKYTEKNMIGEGGFGQVYKAVLNEDQSTVAVKQFPPLEDKDGFDTSIARELFFIKFLRHENIIRVIEICVYGGRLPELSQAFQRIMHRDLKPANILVSMEGVVKITDFGTTRFKHLNEANNKYSSTVCTYTYAPPEQHLGAGIYSESFDMWSLGVIMTEMWTYKRLFKGSNSIRVLKRIVDVLGGIQHSTLPGSEDTPNYHAIENYKKDGRRLLHRKFRGIDITEHAYGLIDDLLRYIPDQRLTASQALLSAYFTQPPEEAENLLSVIE
ncbi:hypothetical protein Aperf_G00000081998 [Anoplocephala perfoliata]